MAFDWNFLPSLISAASGLGGVWLGGRLTWKREALREHDRILKESSYLAILVVAHLDRFVDGCVHVSFDDGMSEGRPAGRDGEYHEITVSAPTFEPLKLDVDWKVLPPPLMYSILNLPYRIEQLESSISQAWEYGDAPDYTDMFWRRQRGYAVLGLEVSELARQLRRHADLPVDTAAEDERDRDALLREQRDKIADAEAAYALRCATFHASLTPAIPA